MLPFVAQKLWLLLNMNNIHVGNKERLEEEP